MQTREAGRKRLRRRMIVSSAAIVVSMLLCLMIASNLIRDIGSYQHDQYTTTACKRRTRSRFVPSQKSFSIR